MFRMHRLTYCPKVTLKNFCGLCQLQVTGPSYKVLTLNIQYDHPRGIVGVIREHILGHGGMNDAKASSRLIVIPQNMTVLQSVDFVIPLTLSLVCGTENLQKLGILQRMIRKHPNSTDILFELVNQDGE